VVPTDVLERLRAFGAAVDSARPGVLEGLYAVGSLALGDFRRPLSNIDAVAVAAEPWDDPGLTAVRRSAGSLRLGRQDPAVACITWEQLASDPGDAAATCFRGRRTVPPDELVNPLTWQVLRTAAVCVRGTEYPDIGPGDLRAWCADRLDVWWRRWLERHRTRPGALWLRRTTAEHVLEVARLSQAVSSGRVVSKVEAGELAVRATRPFFQRIVKDAVGYRQGERLSMYWGPFERKRHALAFIEASL